MQLLALNVILEKLPFCQHGRMFLGMLPYCRTGGYSAFSPSVGQLIGTGACRLQPVDWNLLPRAMLGVLALLCGNGYIVGINQIYDVDIDTVNKPFLPVAAGIIPSAHRSWKQASDCAARVLVN